MRRDGVYRRRGSMVLALATVIVTLSACGTRVSHDALVAGTGGGRQVAAASESTGSSNQSTGNSGTVATTTTTGVTSTSQGSATSGSTSGSQSTSGGSSSKSLVTGSTTAGTTASGSSNSCATSGSTVLLGNVGTYSGVLGAVFSGMQQGLQVWQSYANSCGGLDGHPVKVISEDDGGDPSTSLTDIQNMWQNDHVLAFIGNINLLTIGATQSYFDQNKIPQIGPDGVATNDFDDANIFPVTSPLELLSKADIVKAVAQGKPNIGLEYCVEVPQVCSAEFAQPWANTNLVSSAGGKLVISTQISLTQPSFVSQCQEAQTAGAQALFIAADGNTLGRFVESCNQINYHPLFMTSSLALVNSVTQYAGTSGNVIATVGNFPWADNSVPATQLYQSSIAKYYPSGFPNGAAASLGWTDGIVLQTALKGQLGATPTTQDIYNAMYTIKNDSFGGLTQPLTFVQGQGTSPSNCYFFTAIENNEFVAPDGDKCAPF
jgi:branched-chain amino acid transport system substrate-binding protein